jgi:hypothetical protein
MDRTDNSNGQFNQQYQEQKDKQTQENVRKSMGGGTRFRFSFENSDHYEEFMRRPRSQTYIEAIQMIDMLSSNDEQIMEKLRELVDEDTFEEFSEMSMEEILEEIKRSFEEEFAAAELEFKDVPVPPRPQAVICKCYIDGCDVHAIDGFGNILEHYRKGAPLDDRLTRGREIYYLNPFCSFVEVYPESCRVVNEDGSVKTIDG